MKRRIHLIDRNTYKESADGEPAFWCPVCDRMHIAPRNMWKWNGDVDKPTLGPVTPASKFSYLISYTIQAHDYYVLERPGKVGGIRYSSVAAAANAASDASLDAVWTVKGPIHEPARVKVCCHTYIRDGMIQILADSQRFGGQTLPLPEWEPDGAH